MFRKLVKFITKENSDSYEIDISALPPEYQEHFKEAETQPQLDNPKIEQVQETRSTDNSKEDFAPRQSFETSNIITIVRLLAEPIEEPEFEIINPKLEQIEEASIIEDSEQTSHEALKFLPPPLPRREGVNIKHNSTFIKYQPSEHPITRPVRTEKGKLPSLSLETLKARIRPQQKVVFTAIEHILNITQHNAVRESEGFTVDLPLLEHNTYLWIRCRFSFGKKVIETRLLDVDYQGQPFFPRLIVNKEIAIIPNGVRKEIYAYFLSLKGQVKCPLHQKPRLWLRYAYTQPKWSYQQMFNQLKHKEYLLENQLIEIKPETIKQHFKKTIAKVGQGFFGVTFKDNKLLGVYWVEMGFNLKPIPELLK